METRWKIVVGAELIVFIAFAATRLGLWPVGFSLGADAAAWAGSFGSVAAAGVGIWAGWVALKIARTQEENHRKDAEADRHSKALLLASWLAPGIRELRQQAIHAVTETGFWNDLTFLSLRGPDINILRKVKINVSEEVHRGITEAHVFKPEVAWRIGAMLGQTLIFNGNIELIMRRLRDDSTIEDVMPETTAAAASAVLHAQKAIMALSALQADSLAVGLHSEI